MNKSNNPSGLTKAPEMERPTLSQLRTSNNQLRTTALLYDASQDKEHVLFTTQDQHRRYIHKGEERIAYSLKLLYLAESDITESKFALKYFRSKEHWDRLLDTKIISDLINGWREELRLQLLSKSLENVKDIAEGKGDSKTFPASKFLVEYYNKLDPKKHTRKHKIEDRDVDYELNDWEKEIYEDNILRLKR